MSNPHFTMPKVRIMVADASKARFFSVDSPTGELIELETEANPEGRMHTGDLEADGPGEKYAPGSVSKGMVDEPTDAKDVEIQRFARELVEKLEKERARGEIEKLYVVAPPSFLGELRHAMKPSLKAIVAEEINKDLSRVGTRELRKHLPERLK
ncbi:host attachment protein [Marinobacter salicampi]|uniref:host attachment protein n=1 Tax=Marinobacter salicampi TaxID=435907 RepID=UPI00140DD414|nr:host attachment protein [Marinobacter salicampi]